VNPPARDAAPAAPGETERLFVALTLPAVVRDALAALAEPLQGVAWARPEQIHLTLRFLGDVPFAQIEPMIARLAPIQVEPFLLPVASLGTFPANRPPRVVWAGTGAGHPRLFQLRQRLDDALLATGVAFDVRTFHPHATLARCTEKAAPTVSGWLRRHRDFEAPPFRVEAFDLYASELRPSGAVHTLRHHFPLAR
jgi:RNA 2',3'-cyclic 3'-phosphodiesterase